MHIIDATAPSIEKPSTLEVTAGPFDDERMAVDCCDELVDGHRSATLKTEEDRPLNRRV
ncbi:hypothetical protein [Halogranum amylolyticum]|uniref:hypothetical protein n=1 Tax=Halogranum amylolyticum TaxID=660520 RepID=UPI001B8D8B29|nr:hypothetical protein [Halogranum amylolyticum]